MNKKIILPVILMIVSVALAVTAYVILPETVIIQFATGGFDNRTAPKLLAILLPTALGVGGAVSLLFTKEEESSSGKSLILSVVGIAACILVIVTNFF